MSQWLLLVNAEESKGYAIDVKPKLDPDGNPNPFSQSVASEESAFSIVLYDEKSQKRLTDKSLYESAKVGGSLSYRLLCDEEVLNPLRGAGAFFQLNLPPESVTGRSGDLLFALAVITAALPRAGGYPHFAATGELDYPAGSVYPVNGIPTKIQKAIETLKALPGIKFIFYPIGNDKDVDGNLKAEAKEKYDIELCSLTWFDEALEKLGVPLELYIGNPFMGLQSFAREHRAVYFGRREEAKELAQKLVNKESEAQAPAVAILAASGWGKSSFIQAGLLPELEDQLRLTDRPLLYCLWRLENIRNAVAMQTIDELQLLTALREHWLPETWTINFTEAQLQAIRQANDFPTLAKTLSNALPSDRRMLWAIDQAEELFTLGFTQEAIQGFVAFLSILRDSGVWLLLALRNDFFQDYHKYFGDLFDDHKLWSLRTTLDGIIQEPAKRARRPPIQFESFEDKTTLANLLSKDMPGSPEDALPLLQFALYRLWEMAEKRRRAAMLADDSAGEEQDPELTKKRQQRKTACVLTLEDYEVLADPTGHTTNESDKNRLERVIGKHADDIFQNQEASVQTALPQLLWDLSIARHDPEMGYRFHAKSATLAKYLKDSAEAKLIVALAHEKSRLLILDEGKIRVVHEALFRYWEKARDELKLLSDDMLIRERVQHDWSLWTTEKSADLLLKAGTRLMEAEGLLERQRELLLGKEYGELISYIEISSETEHLKLQVEKLKQRKRLNIAFATALVFSVIAAIAVWQAWEADKQKSQAEINFNKARQSVDELFTQVSESDLLNQPKMEPVRQNLLNKALSYYMEFSKIHATDDETFQGLAEANHKVAEIYSLLGDKPGAMEYFKKETDIYENLEQKYPKSSKYKAHLAACYSNLGGLLDNQSEALTLYNKSFKISEELLSKNPSEPEYQALHAENYKHLGEQTIIYGNEKKILGFYQNAILILENLVMRYPYTPYYQSSLSETKRSMGLVQEKIGNKDESKKAFIKAFQISEKLTNNYSIEVRYRLNKAADLHNLSNSLKNSGNISEAIKLQNKAISIFEKLVQEHPGIPNLQKFLADTHSNLTLLLEKNDPDAAKQSYREATKIYENLLNYYPEVAEYKFALATHLSKTGNIDTMAESELKNLQKAISILEELVKAAPNSREYKENLGDSYYYLAKLYHHEIHNIIYAHNYYYDAEEIYNKLTSEYPDNPEYQSSLALILSNIGKLHEDADEAQLSLKYYLNSVSIFDKIIEKYPNEMIYQFNVAAVNNNLGNLQVDNNFAGAEESYKKAFNIFNKLIKKNENNILAYESLASSYYNFGWFYNKFHKTSKAIESYQNALALYKKLLKENPQNSEYQTNLQATEHYLGILGK